MTCNVQNTCRCACVFLLPAPSR